jgi:glutamate synthase (NADPH/NADH) small chain
VPGRELDGVHFAMDYLYVRNRWVADSNDTSISAKDKNVIVIGGGDTGADCVGNSIREGAASVVQLELLPEPPVSRPDERTPWPLWPLKFRLSYAMEEAKAAGRGEQDFSVVTTELTGNGRVQELHYAQAQAAPPFAPVEGTEGVLDADLVLLAMGFLHPEHEGAVDQLQVEKDQRGNVRAPTYATSVQGVFAAGDARRGQSLIVWAINEGRQCARMVDRYLCGLDSDLAVVGGGGDADEGPEGPPQLAGPGL